MMRNVVPIVMLAVLSALVAGCNVNRDLMFKTPTEFVFDDLTKAKGVEYTIAPNDRLTVQLYSNKGQRLMAMTAGALEEGGGQQMLQQQQRGGVVYRVEPDGTVDLPEVGPVLLKGLTLEEAEQKVQEAYAAEYVDPYALIAVVNNRVLVFPGEAGQATVITLENQNTTVVEVLAQAGGIRQRGRSSRVKLIRQVGEDNQIFSMDLSTIEGMRAARTVVQANDIIYVESNPQIVREVLADVAPVAQLITTFTSLWLTYQVLISQ